MAATVSFSVTIQCSIPSFQINRKIGLSSVPSNDYNSGTRRQLPCLHFTRQPYQKLLASSSSSTHSTPKTRLYVSGISFRTTEESLRNAFQNFGKLVEVNLVMDKIANRPRGFAFLRYATEEESQKAIEGMHGKFLDGRVIFVEVAKSRAELRQGLQHKQF
ncbi:organelle RRM domain-containing protein 6, chloroplastic isoform X2 [Ricinus communis]|uniref:organelle RRM domain-containing protein 6, chloroplastic isoform X2 n=1 Tax=Ricinus communis TaxID=3988 RepID=UPI000772CAEA|nr:organelle RRM domain-containing protein 6, chloroplastic isoform X2 [Ricinus communis]|eukprot:XP_015579912.1 organelle RRM domain-containing protein 6, chloroplastic isoform X2 [Ricinus communis]